MKKMGIVFTAAMMLLWGSAAFAEGAKTTLGVKAWFSSWENADSTGTNKYDGVWMIGPTVDVELENKIFFKGSMLFAVSDHEDTYFDAPFVAKNTISDRKNFDLIAGYMFTPHFGAFAGYKFDTYDFTYEWPVGTVFYAADAKIKGPGVGVSGSYPVNKAITLYGSFAWMFLDVEYSSAGGSGSDDMDGPSIEIGAAFSTSANTAINVGYKNEKFSGSYSDGSGDFDLAFEGLTAGFKYSF